MILNAHKGQGVTIALAIVLFIGLAIRLSYLMINAGAPDFDSPVLDPQLNDYWARALVTSDWSPPPHADDPQIRTTPYGRPPGYPWLLAALYYLSNGSYVIPRIVQLLVGLINIILVFFLTKRLFNAQAGIAAAFLLSVYWAAVYFEGELNSPVWEVFLSLSTVLILLRWEERSHIFLLVLAGITLGAGVLLRPNVLLTGVFLTLWIFYIGYKRYGTPSKSIVRCGVFIIACILTLAPALIRNYAVSGEFVLISYYGGINTYIGNNTEADGVSPTVPDLYEISGSDQWNCFTYPHVVQGLGRYLKQPEFGYADSSRYFYGRAIAFWRKNPLQGIQLTLRKAWLFWSPHEISDSKVIYYERIYSPLLRWLPGFSFLLAMALLGMLFSRLRTPPSHPVASKEKMILVLFCAGVHFLSILPFFIAGRYRFPLVPLLLPFAGYALLQLLSFLHRKEIKRFVSFTAIGAVLYLIVSWPIFPYTPDLSVWHCHRGIAHAAQERTTSARTEFLKAIKSNPKNDEALIQLGYLCAQQGHNGNAMEYYCTAVEANPNNIYAQNNLGYEYFRRGQYKKAEAHYRFALKRKNMYTLARNNLGNALLEQDRPKEALEEFEQVLHINSKDLHARYNIGNVYLHMKHYDKAIRQYQDAFVTTPDNPNIANNLGLALLRKGELRQSILWFEKALVLAPDHTLAHSNLAAVYESIGEPEKALKHLR